MNEQLTKTANKCPLTIAAIAPVLLKNGFDTEKKRTFYRLIMVTPFGELLTICIYIICRHFFQEPLFKRGHSLTDHFKKSGP